MAPWQAAAPRLVGRGVELGHLRGRLDQLRTARTGGLVLLTGEAGWASPASPGRSPGRPRRPG